MYNIYTGIRNYLVTTSIILTRSRGFRSFGILRKKMGAHHTAPAVGKGQTTLTIVDRLHEALPIKIPRLNNLTTADLSGNHLRELPRTLERLVNLNLSRNKIIEFPRKMAVILANYKSLEFLDLSSNGMTSFPEILTTLRRLKRINLSDNLLSSLPLFPEHVEIIELTQNRFTAVPDFSPGLLVLCLDFNLIEEFSKELTGLHRLYFNMNRLARIDPGLHFEHLEILELSKNRLESLPNLEVFAPNLKKFNASLNFLVEFPVFPKSITEIVLSFNRIREIPSNLKDLTNLTQLDMTGNELELVPELPSSIRSFVAVRNKIRETTRCSTPMMNHLLLIGNQMEAFPLYENNDVREMFVIRNLMKGIALECLCENLTRINANQNNITEIPPELFRLPKLTHLSLAKNCLTTLPEEIKDSKLVCLNISENPVSVIPNVLPKTLVAFYCSYCGLKELPECMSELKVLETLVAAGNELTDIPPLSRILKKLLISRNKFTELTDCFPGTLLILDLSHNEISSASTDISCPALLDLDLSHNQMTELPVLTDCMRLRSLKLSHNPLSGVLDLQQFPFLECLDVAFTNLEIPEIEKKSMREMIVSNPELFVSPHYKLMVTPDPWIGYAEMCGQRETMEDAIVVRPGIIPGCDLYCVFDGHGGSSTSNFAAYQIARIFQKNGEFSENFVKSAIAKLDRDLREQDFNDGSTMALALVSGTEAIIAHLGDSRVLVLKDNGEISFATKDHKPDNREEIDRILEIGGKVVGGRTDGMVAVARSLGDYRIFGVGTEPDIRHVDLTEDDRWLIVACDGLFDTVPNDCVGLIAKNALNASTLARDLRNIAYNRLCPDNISVVAVDLHGME